MSGKAQGPLSVRVLTILMESVCVSQFPLTSQKMLNCSKCKSGNGSLVESLFA